MRKLTVKLLKLQIDGDKLEQIQNGKEDNAVGSRIVRYVDDDDHYIVELTAMKPGAVIARRVHQRRVS